MYIVSLIPAVLLAVAIVRILTGAQTQIAFPVLVSIIVCATHIVVLIMYPIRRTKPLALLLGAMGCVSIVCLFLLAVSGRPNYEVHSTTNLPGASSAPPPK